MMIMWKKKLKKSLLTNLKNLLDQEKRRTKRARSPQLLLKLKSYDSNRLVPPPSNLRRLGTVVKGVEMGDHQMHSGNNGEKLTQSILKTGMKMNFNKLLCKAS